MGMHVLQGEYVQKTLDLFDYKITVTAAPDETITTNETFQFDLADIFKEIQLDTPRETKATLEGNTVTWEVGTLNPAVEATTSPLVLGISAKCEKQLQEGDLIA